MVSSCPLGNRGFNIDVRYRNPIGCCAGNVSLSFAENFQCVLVKGFHQAIKSTAPDRDKIRTCFDLQFFVSGPPGPMPAGKDTIGIGNGFLTSRRRFLAKPKGNDRLRFGIDPAPWPAQLILHRRWFRWSLRLFEFERHKFLE